jgi:hypothetical protein
MTTIAPGFLMRWNKLFIVPGLASILWLGAIYISNHLYDNALTQAESERDIAYSEYRQKIQVNHDEYWFSPFHDTSIGSGLSCAALVASSPYSKSDYRSIKVCGVSPCRTK